MSIAILLCFLAQLALDSLTRRPAALNRIWLPALMFLAALAWGALQRVPIFPVAWAHPVWQDGLETLSSIMASAPVGANGSDGAGARAPSPERMGTPVVSADPSLGSHVLMRLAAYAMVFWIALRSAADRGQAMAMLRVFALMSTAFAGYGLYAWSSGGNPILGESATGNLSSTFVNRNNYATFAAFGMLANLAVFLNVSRSGEVTRRNPLLGFVEGFFTRTWIWMFGVILCGGAMLLTQSRAGSAAGIIGLLVFASVHRNRGSRSPVGPVVIIGCILLAILLTSSFGVIDRLMSTSDENGRFAIFPRVLEGIADRPLLGHGLGSFQDAFRVYVPVEAARADWYRAHNSYLENMFELGLPAAAAFYAALLLVGLRLLAGLSARKRGRTVLAFALGAYVTAAFHAGFDFSLQMPALAAVFAWILGVGYAQSFPEKEMDVPRPRKLRSRADGASDQQGAAQ